MDHFELRVGAGGGLIELLEKSNIKIACIKSSSSWPTFNLHLQRRRVQIDKDNVLLPSLAIEQQGEQLSASAN